MVRPRRGPPLDEVEVLDLTPAAPGPDGAIVQRRGRGRWPWALVLGGLVTAVAVGSLDGGTRGVEAPTTTVRPPPGSPTTTSPVVSPPSTGAPRDVRLVGLVGWKVMVFREGGGAPAPTVATLGPAEGTPVVGVDRRVVLLGRPLDGAAGAWAVDATGVDPPRDLGPAQQVVRSSRPGFVWRQDGSEVREVAMDGASGRGPVTLPGGTVVAEVGDSLILQRDGQVVSWRPEGGEVDVLGEGRFLDAVATIVLWQQADGAVVRSDTTLGVQATVPVPVAARAGERVRGVLLAGGTDVGVVVDGALHLHRGDGRRVRTVDDVAVAVARPSGGVVVSSSTGMVRAVDRELRVVTDLVVTPLPLAAMAAVPEQEWANPVVAEDLAAGWTLRVARAPGGRGREAVAFTAPDLHAVVELDAVATGARLLADGTLLGVVPDWVGGVRVVGVDSSLDLPTAGPWEQLPWRVFVTRDPPSGTVVVEAGGGRLSVLAPHPGDGGVSQPGGSG